MADTYKTVYVGGEGEIEEKKSRFIAHVASASTEEEASAFIADIKKKYWDARHNCSAFILGTNSEIARSSDDGEPSGTAGKPILEVLMGEHLTDTVVVVTRYFGGTLLGTGGLIRAYTQATQEGIRNSTVIEKRAGIRLKLKMDYTTEGKVRYIFAEKKLTIEDAVYTEAVELFTIIDKNEADAFIKDITEKVNGRINIEKEDEVVFAVGNGEIILF